MKYMLLMYANESYVQSLNPEEQKALAQSWYPYLMEAQASGLMVSNNGLLPTANATTVRVRENKTLTTDGPFAETHEQLGGFSVFECKDLDEAIAWAVKIPTAKIGSIEIRPLWSQG